MIESRLESLYICQHCCEAFLECTCEFRVVRVLKEHVCIFSGHRRIEPAGGNRHKVSVLIEECYCGKLRAKYPDKLTYWDKRWLARWNHRIDCHNVTAHLRATKESY